MVNKVRKLITTKCELMVSPMCPITPDDRFVFVEFVSGNGVDPWSTIAITDNPICYEYSLGNDGLYMYNRWQILISDSAATEFSIYYNPNDGKLYEGNIALSAIRFNELVPVIQDDVNITKYNIYDHIEEPVFSICKISKCLEDNQRKFIFNTTHDCRAEWCEDSKQSKFERDFLFSSVFVLRYLIRQQRFAEAKQILDSITRCD